MTRSSIGSQLKKARQKKEVTLSEVYQQTRIHTDILSALEEDRYDNILNPIYIKSFLKRYASYLGLDTAKLLGEYSVLHEEEEPKEEKKKEAPKKERPKLSLPRLRLRLPQIGKEKIIRIARLAVVFIGIILAVFILVKSTFFVVSKVSQGFAKLANQAEEMKKAAQAKKTESAKEAQPPKSQPKKAVTVTVASPKKETLPMKKTKEPTLARQDMLSIPAQESLKLTIRATDDVWIQLRVDGKIIFQNVLRKGSTETWKADESFEIWTGRSEALYLNLNGNNLGVLGSGVKRGVLITRRGIKR